MNKFFRSFAVAALSCLLIACTQSHSALNRAENSALPENIGLFGYSPVSYFEKNLAEKGNPAHSYSYKGRLYYFASQDQVNAFKAGPKQYLPRFGEYCPYSLSLGRKVGIDPTNFKVRNGELLLFHNQVELSTVNDVAMDEMYELANKEFKLLEF
ncbi:MAG: YHS domain-containing (seleno)protein [Halioglobus sp.]